MRALPDNPVLRPLCPHSHAPVCFPRPWELLLCSSCAAEGTHVGCSNLSSSMDSWECDGCAGLGTGKRQSPHCPCAGAGGQARPGSACPRWAWQSLSAPGGLAAWLLPLLLCAWEAVPLTFLLPLPASSPSLDLASPSTASQPGEESHSSSPARQGGLRPSSPGPMRDRNRSRSHHRAPNPYTRLRGCRDRSRVPAPRAGSGTSSQAVQGPSISSPAPEASSPSTARQLASQSSRGSHVLERSRGSSPPGPVRTQDRYKLHRWAQQPYSRAGRRRGTSHVPSFPAGPDPPPPAQ